MSRKRKNTSSFSLETLEQRQMLSVAPQVNYKDFSSAAGLIGNGFGDTKMFQNGKLRLTQDEFWQSRSVFFDTRVPIERFRTDFSFRTDSNADGADGIAFAILNGPSTELGANGRGLGYGNIKSPSAAFAFNQFNFHQFGSKFGFAKDGERPGTNTDMKSINLHNGHLFKVTATYDGTTLNVTVSDATDGTSSFSASEEIDLKQQLGSGDAIVGFTAATGANSASQDILSWRFSGEVAPAEGTTVPTPTRPTITVAANVAQRPATGTSVKLNVLADDANGEGGLNYTWRVIAQPAGVKAPTYTDNRSNAAKDTTAHFSAEGAYRFRVTVVNGDGLKSYSDVDVDVTAVATSIRMTPHLKKVQVGKRVQFRATMLDQFNTPMSTQPKFRFSILNGGDGTISARTGLFTAPSAEGHVDIGAVASGISGKVGVTVYPLEDRHTGTAST